MANLLLHKSDIGIDREAHFHTTSYGKTARNGVGAIYKREARQRSLQIIDLREHILTPNTCKIPL